MSVTTEIPADIVALVDAVETTGSDLGRDGILAVASCMATTRAIRRFRPDPVDPGLVELVLRLATTAGSGANLQPWRFVVVTSPERRGQIADWYREGWAEYQVRGMATLGPDASALKRRSVASAAYLAEHFADAPVLIVPCLRLHPRHRADLFAAASLYPAVQNLLLAARALGLGTSLTSMQALSGVDERGRAVDDPRFLDGLRSILGIPHEAVPGAVIPLGWPDEHFGPTTRRPVAEVAYRERWGEEW